MKLHKLFNAESMFGRYWHLLGAQRKGLPRVLLASFVTSGVDVLGIGLVGPFVASLVSPEIIVGEAWYQSLTRFFGTNAEPVTVMAAALMAAFALKLIVSWLVLAEFFRFCGKLDQSLRVSLMHRLYAMDLSRVANSQSSSFVQAVHGFTGQFAYGLVGAQLRLVTEILISTAILAYLLYLNPLGLSVLLVLVALVVLTYDAVFKRRIQSYGTESAHSGELLIRAVQQVVGGLREIRVYGVENRLQAKAIAAAERFSALNARYQWINATPKYLIEFCLMSAVCVLVLTMHSMGMPKEKMFALMGVFGVAVVRLAPAANLVLTGLSQLRFNRFVIDRLWDELQVSKLAAEPKDGHEQVAAIERVELLNVGFRHAGQEDFVFRNVNLSIARGESIGLVGPSGSGKTTLAEMILGFWEPSEGEISINGLPRGGLSRDSLRGHFAYIPQQLFLLDASVADNISLLDPDEPTLVRERTNAAAAAARLDAHFVRHGIGLDAPCGENGARLSGGQRQRVALARAFYYKRSIIVMDEATSALDYETEREIIDEIRALKGLATTIVIAHRLETVAACDRLFRVENGAVREIDRSELGLTRARE